MSRRLSQYPGPGQEGFDRKQTAPALARKAVELISDAAKTPKPFFLYFALTGPHSPIIPTDEFKGRSGIGDYGDFVMEMDWTVGEVMKPWIATAWLPTRWSSSPRTTARRIGITRRPATSSITRWVRCAA